MNKSLTYLALGDSYTIGESVLLIKSFPYQVVQILRDKGHNFSAPEILAKTGWTTGELLGAFENYHLLPQYNFVSLLIGVNNQYRGRSVEEFKIELVRLLTKAIELANNKKEHVIVLSIPDYSVTPFAANMDVEKIEKQIELFNSVKKVVCLQYKVHFIDITPGTREAKDDNSLLTEDKLHPAETEYTKWAEKIAEVIKTELK